MDYTLRPVTLSHDTPWWIKAMPLVFVALVAYGVATGKPAEREPERTDPATQSRPR